MTSIQTALQEFILSTQADGLSDSTTKWYGWLLAPFAEAHTGRELATITAHDMRVYLVSLRQRYTSEDTIHDHHRALNRFWKWCSQEYGIRNPMGNIKTPKQPVQATPKAASLEDVIAMFEAARGGQFEERDQALLMFALDTGCRSQGIRELTVSNLDLEKCTAIVTEKGGKTRSVPLTKVTIALLIRWFDVRQPVETVFYSSDTLEPFTKDGLYTLFRRLARRAHIQGRFNPHSFRHALTLEYLKAGGDQITLARILGHSNLNTLARYYAIFRTDEIAAAHEQYSPVSRLADDDHKR